MTGPVRPADPVRPRGPQRRTGDRRQGDERREGAPVSSRALVVPPASAKTDSETPVPPISPSAVSPSGPAVSYAAQLLGQKGGRKGLKGGPPVLNAARGAYLETEYSGENDRRPTPGKTRRTDV